MSQKRCWCADVNIPRKRPGWLVLSGFSAPISTSDVLRRSAANVRKNENAATFRNSSYVVLRSFVPRPRLLRDLGAILIYRLSPANSKRYIHPASSADSANFLSLEQTKPTARTAISSLRSHDVVDDTKVAEGGIRILSSLLSMHRELFCQTVKQ